MPPLFQPDMSLTSTIQVGIAIAGFTGIVIALSKPDANANSRALLVSILLLSSIGSVFFSFVPMLLSLAGLDASTVWRTSSAAFLHQFPNVFSWGAAWPYLALIVTYVIYSFSVFVTLLWDVWRDIHEARAPGLFG